MRTGSLNKRCVYVNIHTMFTVIMKKTISVIYYIYKTNTKIQNEINLYYLTKDNPNII